jgi:hypothetical protein
MRCKYELKISVVIHRQVHIEVLRHFYPAFHS